MFANSKGNECQDNYCPCYEVSMVNAKHWTVEPDAEAPIKVSLPISFWQYHPNSTLQGHCTYLCITRYSLLYM